MTEYEKEFNKLCYTGNFIDDLREDNYKVREKLIKKYSFAILTEEVISKCKKYSPILEVGAGTGYWAFEFKKHNIEYIATDVRLRHCNFNNIVEKLEGVKAINKYPYHSLLMCWPSYNVSWPSCVLDKYNGDYLIYVGEGSGGCTADYKFHNIICKNFNLIETMAIPKFPCIYDSVRIFSRKL